MKRFILKFFSEMEDVIGKNEEAFKEEGSGKTLTDSYNAISEQFKALGYSLIINHNESEEFVPKTRVTEVTSQKNKLKDEVGNLTKSLSKLKKSVEDNPELEKQYQDLIDTNKKLLGSLDSQDTDFKLVNAARSAGVRKEALNDILNFINKENIQKVNGNLLGIEAEFSRLKKEKVYLFDPEKEEGDENNNDRSHDRSKNHRQPDKSGMNSIIRNKAR